MVQIQDLAVNLWSALLTLHKCCATWLPTLLRVTKLQFVRLALR
jgi:hypothetical protein